MSLKYKRKDYDKLRDQFYQNPGVNPISGYKITIGKDTYNKLVNEFGDPYQLLEDNNKKITTFPYFEQLPLELQTDIYGRHKSTLINSPKVSKMSNKATKDILCNLEITNKEFIQYIYKNKPYVLYAFPYPNLFSNNKNKFGVTKFKHIVLPKRIKYKYAYISVDDNMVEVVTFRHDGTNFKNINFLASEFDLFTSYLIYKERQTCQHIQNYAKKQVIKLLTNKKQNIQNNIISILGWYIYLETNLKQFAYELDDHYLFDYDGISIEMDEKGNAIEYELQLQLYDICDVLYQDLLERLQNLT